MFSDLEVRASGSRLHKYASARMYAPFRAGVSLRPFLAPHYVSKPSRAPAPRSRRNRALVAIFAGEPPYIVRTGAAGRDRRSWGAEIGWTDPNMERASLHLCV